MLRFLFLMLAFYLSSCSISPYQDSVPEQKNFTLSLKFDATWNEEPFQLDRIIVDDYGNLIRPSLFMHYVSYITLIAEDGTEVPVKDFMLIDYERTNELVVEVPANKYTSMKFGLGIPPEFNKDQDPAQYPSSSPLSVAGCQGMFWTWNTGYIFSKLLISFNLFFIFVIFFNLKCRIFNTIFTISYIQFCLRYLLFYSTN